MPEKIMVVDDEPDLESLIKQKFRRQIRAGEYDFVFARNGLEALAKLLEHPDISLVLSDINMPEMDGLEFVIQVRQLPNYAKTPIMMVTTEGGKMDVIEALTKGVDSYVVKPFTPEVIQKKMEELKAKMPA